MTVSLLFQEEDDVALLERQALEDLGLLKITNGSHKELAASCSKVEENGDVTSSPLFNALTDSSRCEANENRTLQSLSIYRPAAGVLDSPRSSCNTTSTSTSQHLSFDEYPSHSLAERFAFPTPSRDSGTNISNTLRNSSFTPRERELVVTSTEAPPISFNSSPSFNHQELSENSAPLVEGTGTWSALRQRASFTKYSKITPAPYIAPIQQKVSHRSATSRGTRVTSASSTSPVETPASTSKVAPSKERDDRPVQIVSPTPKAHHFRHVPSDNRSLSLRSAVLSLNPGSFSRTTTTTPVSGGANTRFRWEPNGHEVTSSAFGPGTSAFRRLPKTLAQDALLDMEVSVYMTAGHDSVITAGDWCDRPINPLTKVFSEGDSMVSATLRSV